jgi:hypothetical protein
MLLPGFYLETAETIRENENRQRQSLEELGVVSNQC